MTYSCAERKVAPISPGVAPVNDRAIPVTLIVAATFLTGLVWLLHLLPVLRP
jgi:hypothetical protein